MYRICALLSIFVFQLYANLIPLDKFSFSTYNPDLLTSDSLKPAPYEGGILPIDSPGVYYLKTTLPDTLPPSPRLFLAPSPYAITIHLNGHKIYQWGNGESTPCLANYNAESILIPSEFLSDSTNELLFTFVSDGARISFPKTQIGDELSVAHKQFLLTLLNSIGIKIIVGISLFACLFLVIYFFVTACKDLSILLLALFCLSLVAGYNMFVLNSYFFDQVVLFKIARIGGAMMSLFNFLFITAFTGILSAFLYRMIVSAAFIPYLILILQAESKFQINSIFNAATNTLIFPLLLVSLILLLLDLIRSKRPIILAVLIPYLFLMAAVFSDMGYMILFQQPLFWKIPYGYLMVVVGGTFTVLYSRTCHHTAVKLECIDLNKKIDTIESNRKDESQNINLFLQQFSTSARHIEESFASLIHSKGSETSQEQMESVYSQFILNSVNANNMQYLEKIKQNELNLWFDGFSLIDLLQHKQKAFINYAEEQGITLSFSILEQSLPQLVWGDRDAVFQVIANMIICSVEIEPELVKSCLRYVPLEGVEVSSEGSTERFTKQFMEMIQTGSWNGKLFPAAVVLRELLSQLYTECTVQYSSLSKSDSIKILIPLKLSEL